MRPDAAPRAAPAALALLIHIACVPAAIAVAPALSAVGIWPQLEGIAAAALGHSLGLAAWWLPINLFFVPALTWLLAFDLPPAGFLGVFLLLALIYWTVFRSRVPLYHSSRAACTLLARLLPPRPGFRFADLGCGCGGVLLRLARARPDGDYFGIEAAPLPCLVSGWRLRRRADCCRVRWGDFWTVDLARFDVVYAYLSPVPMPRLWEKAQREMRPGALFVSNSFAVPGVAPDYSIAVRDRQDTALHVWRM